MGDWSAGDGTVDPIGGGQPLTGVAVAVVVANIDETSQGRVQLRLPWLPDVRPWGRVASLSGGPERGAYFMPQVGDEVLVAFHNGDLREVYVIGSLWSSVHKAPVKSNLDPVNRRVIRTPAGHEIELDDKTKSVTVLTATGHKLRMEPEKIELSTEGGSATLVLEQSGAITLKANTSVKVEAPDIQLEAAAKLTLHAPQVEITADAMCQIKGATVKMN